MLTAFFTEKFVDGHGSIILNHFRHRGNQDNKDIFFSQIIVYLTAIASISTLTSLGRRATWTAALAG
jgi:hypothetical protein